jgi:hypothetical protein
MGYAQYRLPDGQQGGYAVEAMCDEPGCTERIDRGLAYLCGTHPGGSETSCGGYFCGSHLYHGRPHQMCGRCLDDLESLPETGDS